MLENYLDAGGTVCDVFKTRIPPERRSSGAKLKKLSLVDRIFLSRRKVAKVSRIADHITLYHIVSDDFRFVVKFRYAGNVQYHKLTDQEARTLVNALSESDGP
nr:hypothetical protein [Marinicella sp. W31]MDC2876394.1 hypothetical protein [Marinicella sp. W31]